MKNIIVRSQLVAMRLDAASTTNYEGITEYGERKKDPRIRGPGLVLLDIGTNGGCFICHFSPRNL